MKLDKERQGKVNTIISEIEEIMVELKPMKSEKEIIISYIANILCQLDIDIAIDVMEGLGEAGEYQAMAIKVNYGY